MNVGFFYRFSAFKTDVCFVAQLQSVSEMHPFWFYVLIPISIFLYDLNLLILIFHDFDFSQKTLINRIYCMCLKPEAGWIIMENNVKIKIQTVHRRGSWWCIGSTSWNE